MQDRRTKPLVNNIPSLHPFLRTEIGAATWPSPPPLPLLAITFLTFYVRHQHFRNVRAFVVGVVVPREGEGGGGGEKDPLIGKLFGQTDRTDGRRHAQCTHVHCTYYVFYEGGGSSGRARRGRNIFIFVLSLFFFLLFPFWFTGFLILVTTKSALGYSVEPPPPP